MDRKNAGEALVEAVRAASFDAPDHFGWSPATTERRARWPRSSEDYKIGKKSIKARAYWVA